MQENKQHLLENLLNDTSFKNWVYKKNRNDIAFWNNWIANNAEYIDTIYAARDIVIGIRFNKSELSEDLINDKLDNVIHKITKNTESTIDNGATSKKKIKLIYATSVLLSGIILFFAANFFTATSEVIHKTGFGEIIDLKLPDGTTVVLNGNSELKYNKDNSRDVVLNGEAYFKVKSKPSTKAKFWVTTQDLKVEVFGTHFNVNTRNKKTDVLLDEGSISLLLENGNSTKMQPGEIVTYSKESDKIVHNKVNSNIKYTHWIDGTYIFNNVTLIEVMQYIENAYGIASEFKNPNTKNIVITGGIPNENLTICIMALEKASGVTIQKQNNKLLIIEN